MRLFLALALFSHFAHGALKMTGAGATFPYPIYSKWFSEYAQKNTNVQINYQSVGSGAGIKQLIAQTVDFGASDVPMSPEELGKMSGGVLQLPTVIGAVAVVTNVPGVPLINMDGPILVDIYLGKITRWDDARIKALNTKVVLPSLSILVTQRADASGTTSLFTEYLASQNPLWKSEVGVAKAVSWPVGTAAKGNEGVTGLIKTIKGSIGYVELSYVTQNKLGVVALKNTKGDFVLPTVESATLAAKGIKNPLQSLLNSGNKGAYPLTAMTYLLIPLKLDAAKKVEFKKFIKWMLTEGQGSAVKLEYAPLPKDLVGILNKDIDSKL